MKRSARKAGAPGFTIIELLVIISIITLLLGILLPALSSLLQSGKKQKVRSAMQRLLAAQDEYETVTGYTINIEGDLPIEWDGQDTGKNPSKMNSIERFVWAAQRTEASETLVNQVPDSLLVDQDGDGFLEVRDPWGHMLEYRPQSDETDKYRHAPPPGSNNANSSLPSNSGDEELPEHGSPFFASPGPNGEWEPNDSEADDIYSIEID
jgi:type II secretory pathway pseudopilin PulG